MDKFVELLKTLRLNLEDIENLKRLINSKETETAIKTLPQNKSPKPDSFMGKLYQISRDDLIPISNKASITLIPKPKTTHTKKENYKPIKYH